MKNPKQIKKNIYFDFQGCYLVKTQAKGLNLNS